MIGSLATLFPDGDFRFHLTLQRVEPATFFRPRDASGAILRERARWIDEMPSRYLALRSEGEPLLAEFATMAAGWGVAWDGTMSGMGRAMEPDVLFLSPDESGQFCLRGGALCFPTGWALEEKLGHSMDFIHGVVPGLNPALASPIHQFLAKLKPGVAFLRDNWGLAANDALNHHPAQNQPGPRLPVSLERLWLRVEHQALMALPHSRGVAFAIRIANHRLDAVAAVPALRAGLRLHLASMPVEMARYKRIDAVIPALCERLAG